MGDQSLAQRKEEHQIQPLIRQKPSQKHQQWRIIQYLQLFEKLQCI